MSILDQYAVIGVTVFLPTVSFRVELGRRHIQTSLDEIETYLTAQGIEDDVLTRVGAVIANAEELADIVAGHAKTDAPTDADYKAEDVGVRNAANPGGPINDDDLVAEIAYAFLYAHTKQYGRDIDLVRGVVGGFFDGTLYLKPAATEGDYNRLSNAMHKSAARMLDLEPEDYTADFLADAPEDPVLH